MNLRASILKLIARKSYSGNFEPRKFRRILIVRPAKIGDTICLFPLIRELKKNIPSANIDVYASTYNNFMFRFMPQVRHVYTRYKRHKALTTLVEIFRMRRNHYELVIDTMDIRFGKVMALALIKADWLVANTGYERHYGMDNSDLGLYYKLNQWKQIHTTDRLVEFLRLLGIENYDNKMEFPLDGKTISFAESFLRPHADYKLVGLNAEATSKTRTIPNSGIIQLCKGLAQRDKNIKILLFSSPARHYDMNMLIENSKLNNVVVETGTKDIFDAAALVSFMKVMISPDTSFIHIASAFDIPTVAIYPNDPQHLRYWGPRSSKHVVIQPDQSDGSINDFSISGTVRAALKLLNENI